MSTLNLISFQCGQSQRIILLKQINERSMSLRFKLQLGHRQKETSYTVLNILSFFKALYIWNLVTGKLNVL